MKKIYIHLSLVFIILLISLLCFLDNYSQEASLIREYYDYNDGKVPERIDSSMLKSPQLEYLSYKFIGEKEYKYYDSKYLKKTETILKHLKDNGEVLPPHDGRDFYAGERSLVFKIKGGKKYSINVDPGHNTPNAGISSLDKKEIGFYDTEEKYEKMFTEVYEYVFFNAMKEHEEYEKSLSN